MDSIEKKKLNVLIADDEPSVLSSLSKYLESRHYRLFPTQNGKQAIEVLKNNDIAVAITAIRMPEADGFEVLNFARQYTPSTDVIVMTGHGDIETAVRAIREGAFDFFSKPVKLRELNASLERTTRFHALRQENERYREQIDRLTEDSHDESALIGDSPAMQKVRDLITTVNQSEGTTVLVRGETGTGKELVAQAIHYSGTRSKKPFVAVNCTSLPETLIESELYGHNKGAFTDAKEMRRGYFEQADGGTIFLDEIGDMPLAMQSRLLRTLEERRIRRVGSTDEIPVDLRVISATNRNLEQSIIDGTFRQDLYYRLNTVTINIPPLRERREDIPLLARHFLNQTMREVRKPLQDFSPEAEQFLYRYDFPGNVRELRNIVERAVLLCQGTRITIDDLQLPDTTGFDKASAGSLDVSQKVATTTQMPLNPDNLQDLNLEAIEREAVRVALERTNNNQVQAAHLLGISRTALHRRLRKWEK